jgi:hypothetical protein
MVAHLSQNQHLSSALFLISFRYTADRQCPVPIWAAALAMELGALSMQDFFAGRGEVSSFPWCVGSLCQSALASLNLSDTRSLKWDREAVGDHTTFSAACPASMSALSLPGFLSALGPIPRSRTCLLAGGCLPGFSGLTWLSSVRGPLLSVLSGQWHSI